MRNGLYPGGSYAIKEIQPSDGYNLDTSTYIVELNFKDSSTAVVTASRVSYEKVIRSDIELSKFGTDSVDTENTKKIPLKGVIFSIQSLTTNQKWYMVTNENGYIDSVTDKIWKSVLPLFRKKCNTYLFPKEGCTVRPVIPGMEEDGIFC